MKMFKNMSHTGFIIYNYSFFFSVEKTESEDKHEHI